MLSKFAVHILLLRVLPFSLNDLDRSFFVDLLSFAQVLLQLRLIIGVDHKYLIPESELSKLETQRQSQIALKGCYQDVTFFAVDPQVVLLQTKLPLKRN